MSVSTLLVQLNRVHAAIARWGDHVSSVTADAGTGDVPTVHLDADGILQVALGAGRVRVASHQRWPVLVSVEVDGVLYYGSIPGHLLPDDADLGDVVLLRQAVPAAPAEVP